MDITFATARTEPPGTIAALLGESYAAMLESDPAFASWVPSWSEYDREVYAHPDTVGACIFFTRCDGALAGFGSWDPRQGPAYGIVGHNCVLPAFRGRGIGSRQMREILARLRTRGIQAAQVTTESHPLFLPARRMYEACGFREVRRIPWDNGQHAHIEYARPLLCV